MAMNAAPSANRIHIGIFGVRNAGKSSVINAMTGQQLAVVSDIKGTTTDPVYKAMELPPVGPVVLIDTPGIDDAGPLGAQRVQKARQVLNKSDVALLVVDAATGLTPADTQLLSQFDDKRIPYLIAYNKADLLDTVPDEQGGALYISAQTGLSINPLKQRLAELAVPQAPQQQLVADLIKPADFVVLVTPIDAAAPKGRLILPQQQTIRDILDTQALAIVTQPQQLPETLARLGKRPRLVITDSQVFARVAADVPADIPLTSFSILFARYKGLLQAAVRGAVALDALRDGDTLLISEGCTHHRQCEDIGTVKLPRWISDYTGKQLEFVFTSGGSFPPELQRFSLIIHCGGCMLNEREMIHRQQCAQQQRIPITNYGVAIAYMQGILRRSVAMLPNILAELER